MRQGVRRWLFEDALPVWSGAGLDAPGLGFVERLDLEGAPDLAAPKRVRVQARQVYVFSHAALLGWAGGLQAAEAGMRFLAAHARLEGGGWARTLDREGRIVDATLDLYDQAFVLHGLAWWRRASGDPEAERLARETHAAIRARLGRPDGRGYFADDSGARDGRQNPHMHLFEACLALWEATGDALWAEEAARLAKLFDDVLFDPVSGALAERFDEDWRRIDTAALEPGHQFEWAWLLDRHRRLLGEDRSDQARALMRFGLSRGVEGGVAWDEVSLDGTVLKPSRRLWVQTELLKASLVWPGGEPDRTLDAIFDRYLDPAPRGCWRDQIDAAGRPIDTFVPASSLYHLFLAFSEVLGPEPRA